MRRARQKRQEIEAIETREKDREGLGHWTLERLASVARHHRFLGESLSIEVER